MTVTTDRLRLANLQPERPERELVLYWCIGARRATHNLALDHALDEARRLRRPLLVFEPLRLDYPWASERFHAFVLEGMRDNARAFAAAGLSYFPYVEPSSGAGRGLLEALAQHACLVVTDDVPGFFQPRMVHATAARLDVRLVGVDGNGLSPLSSTTQLFPSALAFRRHLQRTLPHQLGVSPVAAPSGRGLPRAHVPAGIAQRWPAAALDDLEGSLASLPLDHKVGRVALCGGSEAARDHLARFVEGSLGSYADERNHPDAGVASGLSPWLHFGHLSAHEVFAAVAAKEGFAPDRAVRVANGARQGWWGLSASAEAFLDQLVTWRGLSQHNAWHQAGFDGYEAIPSWARASLAQHAGDARPARYSLEELDGARTQDELWNAAQRQLVQEGVMHNYLRMLWGKKVIEWSPSPEEAYARLTELNHRYALDGRDANSVAGIQWCFGRYDRPWGPRRSVFGVVRYMSSDNTRRKLELKRYLERFGAAPDSAPRVQTKSRRRSASG